MRILISHATLFKIINVGPPNSFPAFFIYKKLKDFFLGGGGGLCVVLCFLLLYMFQKNLYIGVLPSRVFLLFLFIFAKTPKNDLSEAVIQCCITVGQPDMSTMVY